MVTVKYNGRISNNFMQYLVGFYLSKKYNLKLMSNNPIVHDTIKMNNLEDGVIGNNHISVNDGNWLDIVFGDKNYENPHFNLNGFFNSKLFFEGLESEIKDKMTIVYDDLIDKNDVMVNYRIGELAGSRRVLPVEYYSEALDSMNFNKGYITSDSLNHKFCQLLIDKYNLTPVNLNPTDTIAFAKNFNKLVLSEGGYSFTIGFLSNANEIICSGRHSNGRELIWHGDIYFDKWKKLNWDYHPDSIYSLTELKGHHPIRLSDNEGIVSNPDGTYRIKTYE